MNWSCELKVLRGVLWLLAEDLTWAEMGRRSKLCYTTLVRFFDGTTKNPTYRTVSSLCQGLGVKITITRTGVSLSRAA